MRLYSTRHQAPEVDFKEAVFKGLPSDNGLFMPHSIPSLPESFFNNIDQLSFQEIALQVSSKLIGDEIPEDRLKDIIYDMLSFDAPVVNIHDNMHVLELFHGPSFAFKDFGARFMARVMAFFLEQEQKEINILVATSGDTGSAVAQGFLGMPGIKVTILYPSGKVSEIQEKQLTTLGQNVTALEVQGTFDDCQRLVKEAFLDEQLNKDFNLSSANSINISRLVPQSFYYFYAYAQLKKQGKPLVFSVPSGNFGNLCGGLIAKRMGLPVHRFIASTNVNDIVPKYLFDGNFSPRESIMTISNAMDVGNPSNFFRLTDLYGNDIEKIRSEITGKSYTDEQTRNIMTQVYEKHGYVLDPHGAVGYLGLRDYLKESGDDANGVFLATAHPAKFLDIVEGTINKKVEIPESLQKAVKQEKKSIPLKPTFEGLKNYLYSK
ncbi:threonine synthase [Cytophagaceae bacterium ABcell3]|nr:threonine synthase [Cytophagaceae bacterium ABcell3]